MKFSDYQSMILEIKCLSIGAVDYACNCMDAGDDSNFFMMLLGIFAEKCGALEEYFDRLEFLPDVKKLDEELDEETAPEEKGMSTASSAGIQHADVICPSVWTRTANS